MHDTEKQAGFALLISLLVVGVVISVGLSVLDLSIKQVQLSSDAKESEQAFHAANAGMECARFWSRKEAMNIEAGQDFSPACFGATPIPDPVSSVVLSASPDGDVFQYEYNFTWGSGTDIRCSRVNMIVGTAFAGGSGIVINNLDSLVSGYPNGVTSRSCDAGSRCSTISVQWYNTACANTNSGFGIVQREVLLEF